MKVTATASVSFPSLGWGIEKGETKDLPEEIADEVLKQHIITKVNDGPAKTASAKGEK